MSDNIIEIADHLIDLCVREVERVSHLRFPHDLMAEIISESKPLQDELKNYGFYDTALDTFTRDDLLDAIGFHFTKLARWPMNMDSEEVSQAFYKELLDRAGEVGVEYVEPDGSVAKIIRGKVVTS
jgi:hypothetical protein